MQRVGTWYTNTHLTASWHIRSTVAVNGTYAARWQWMAHTQQGGIWYNEWHIRSRVAFDTMNGTYAAGWHLMQWMAHTQQGGIWCSEWHIRSRVAFDAVKRAYVVGFTFDTVKSLHLLKGLILDIVKATYKVSCHLIQ